MTQVKLNTEGKRFKGRARVLLEDSLESARAALEHGKNQGEIDTAIQKLSERTTALEDYLESLW